MICNLVFAQKCSLEWTQEPVTSLQRHYDSPHLLMKGSFLVCCLEHINLYDQCKNSLLFLSVNKVLLYLCQILVWINSDACRYAQRSCAWLSVNEASAKCIIFVFVRESGGTQSLDLNKKDLMFHQYYSVCHMMI